MLINPVVPIGLMAVMMAIVILLLLVMRELAPAGWLSGRGRWYLACALGAGVLAFTGKLALIVYFSWFPKADIAWWRPLPKALSDRDAVDTAYVLPQYRYVWQTLPSESPGMLHGAMAAERVALGEKLFNDPNLSRDRTVSCASCHRLIRHAGADGMPTATGINGQKGTRNAPTVWNAAFQSRLFWDGRAGSLEEQAKGPPVNPLEMGMPSLDAVTARVKDNPAYPDLFAKAFGDARIDIDRIAAAIAAFERTLMTSDTPYDRFVRGDVRALSRQKLRGMALFENVGCVRCHSGANFSDGGLLQRGTAYRLFPVVVGSLDPKYGLDIDKGAAPAGSKQAKWRIPSLRNVALTAPYFHNGSVNSLAEAVCIMAKSQLNARIESEGNAATTIVWTAEQRTIDFVEQRRLSEQDVDDMVAFLRALTSDRLARAHQP